MKTRSNSEHRYYIVEIHITLEWSGLKCNPCKSTQTSFDKYILSATTGTAVRESCLMRTAHHYYFSCIVTKTKNTQATSCLAPEAKGEARASLQLPMPDLEALLFLLAVLAEQQNQLLLLSLRPSSST